MTDDEFAHRVKALSREQLEKLVRLMEAEGLLQDQVTGPVDHGPQAAPSERFQ